MRLVAEIAPIRRQIRPEAVVPRKMIGGEIGENEQRAAAALALDHLCCLVVEKRVGLDAGGLLETARAHEGAARRVKRKRLVAAALQRVRQTALDAASGNAGDEI